VCRCCVVVLEVKEKGSGNKVKAGLGVSIQELSAKKIVAIGECTGSDPTSSEAKLLRTRLENNADLGGLLLPGQSDPAAFVESLKNMSMPSRMEHVTANALALMENSGMLTIVQKKQATAGRDRDNADAIRAQFPALASAVIRPYLAPADEGTTALSDAYATQLPVALQTFLPDDQVARMVGSVVLLRMTSYKNVLSCAEKMVGLRRQVFHRFQAFRVLWFEAQARKVENSCF